MGKMMVSMAMLLAKTTLPVKVRGVNGASIQVIDEPAAVAAEAAFFGGYAEDMLVDMGMEAVDSAPMPKLKAKQV